MTGAAVPWRELAAGSGEIARLGTGEITDDKLDEGIVDQISAAGEQFRRLLRILRRESTAANPHRQ